MTKKVTIKDIKIKVKFPETKEIDGYKFKKGEEYELKIEDTDKDLEHKGSFSDKEIKGKITPKKDKETEPEVKDLDVKLKGKFDNGYIYDTLDIEELAIGSTDYKIENQSVKVGGDMWGLNYLAWGGIVFLLVAVIVGGYYWWTSYNKEEEEENL